ncbi:hypothetical protein CWC22_005360 [Pseudoalteromonas rubra]|uniref:Uncharacterized protein n=1 Tax=Pseudoalteromonas rubra TaxID=43658 RepID=A0A5S3UPA6_9GAMM|nr:hypothetical protein [Pseudoalteromonas rubra]QPB82444.1 hypothetical protein CWC22_005360 [Pseudoalteromonas rubra]
MYKQFNAVVFILSLALSFNSYSWDKIVSGKVLRISVNSPASSKRNVMVKLEGGDSMCSLSSNNDTAYINKSEAPDTYDVFVSMLLTAKATSTGVKLYIDKGQEGCQIHSLDLL